MLPQRTGLSRQSPLRPLSVLVFHLLLTQSCRGQSQMIGLSQPIVALVGDDVILPCHLEPAEDVSAMMLEWTRPDLKSIAVFVWRAGKDLVHVKDPSYTGRTSLFTDGLKHGNISLKLSKVKPSDEGRYQCYVPDLDKESLVELVVASGAASSPVITLSGIDEATRGVMLACRSEGWYPEPEVLWLDGEGNLLSAGPPETVRGPDDLYTVSSRVTVEKRHSNSFTCRVQQKNTKQTRETHIQVPDDFFNVQSSSVPVITGLAVSLAVWIIMFILLLLFVLWKWRQIRIKTKRNCRDQTDEGEKKKHSKTNKAVDQCVTEEREREQLMTDGVTVEMEVLKGNEQQKIKHLERSRAAPVRSSSSGFKWPIVSRQKIQDEQQRREEAENRVQILEEELQTKIRELKDKQATNDELKKTNEDLNKTNEDLNKTNEDLNKTNEDLNKTNNELNKTNEDLNKTNEDLKKTNEDLKKTNEDLKKTNEDLKKTNNELNKTNEELKESEHQLKIKNEENSKLIREFNKQLRDQQQKKEEAERELKQLMTKNTEIEKKLQEEKTKREKEVEKLEDKQQAADAQMKKINEELKNSRGEISQLKRELSDEKQKKERAERDLKEIEKQLQEETTKREKEVEKLKEKQAADAQMKKINEELKNSRGEISQLKRNFKKQLRDQQQKKEEAERELKQLMTKIEKKLQEEKTKREEAEKEVENLKKELEDKSSSASQSSNTELPIVVQVNQQENYIRLINTVPKDHPLGGWTLEMEVNRKIISFTFKSSFKLKSRSIVTMSGTGCDPYDPTELQSWKDLRPWNSGDNLKFTLISNTDDRHQLNFFSLKDYN